MNIEINLDEYEIHSIDSIEKDIEMELKTVDITVDNNHNFFIKNIDDKYILTHNSFGTAIKGLLINFIHYMFPELLDLGFCYEFITPIIRAIKGSKVIEYYDLSKYHKDVNSGKLNGYKIKYYKGLGTNTPAEMKQMFRNLDKHLIQFKYNSNRDSKKIDMLFNKKKSDDRKKWILENIDYKSPIKKKINQIDSFIDNEFIQFSNYDNIISIPSFEDGLKPSQRKILYGMIKKNIKDDIKVAQIAGYIAENTDYSHGEVNLYDTTINMSQNFIGTNNLNYFEPIGNFGNRRDPNSAASARYIYTRLNPVINYVFRKEDNIILNHKIEEGIKIEPEYYYPIIPMQLVNGSKGIGTGWSTDIPLYNPNDIINKIKHILRNPKGNFNLVPSYKNWKGEIIKVDDLTYESKGIFKLNKNTLIITELPIGVPTDKYLDHLDKLVEKKDIRNYIDDSTDEIVNIKITFNKVPNDIYNTLKLTSNIKLSNMNVFKNNIITKYESSEQMLKDWVSWRIKFYSDRKNKYLIILNNKQDQYTNLINFIESVIKGDIIINNRKRDDIIKDLEKKKFLKIEDSYNYLLNIPLYNLTKEKYLEYKNNLKEQKKYISEYKKMKPEELWIIELDELKKQL